MCVNYTPTRRHELGFFGISANLNLPDWPGEAWANYNAPIIVPAPGGGRRALVASYGMTPKRKLPAGMRRFDTLNARAETIGEKRSYAKTWAACQLCLVPMRELFEPCWVTGKHERYAIGMADDSLFAVAGLWREWDEPDGEVSHSFTQITINADQHPLMKRFHRPGDEKRSLVIIAPEEYDDWMDCRAPEKARGFLHPFPSELMKATPAPRSTAATGQGELQW